MFAEALHTHHSLFTWNRLLFLSAESDGDEKWPLTLMLSYIRQVLRMENIRSYLSFKNRIRIFIEAIQITVFT